MRVGIRGDLERRKCVDFNTSRKWDRENLKKLVLQYIGEHYDAVVIESFGVGGLPSYGNTRFPSC